MGVLGKAFKKDAKLVAEYLNKLKTEDVLSIEKNLSENKESTITVNDKDYKLTPEMITVKRYQKTVHVEELTPSVIEPSFGIGRIMYSVFEHNFKIREGDEQRSYLSLPASIAPYKCSVLPISNNPDFGIHIKNISQALNQNDISHKVDDSSGSIGRRYARTDQIAIPYGITIDFDTLKDTPPTATLRERDSMKQIRASLKELPQIVKDLVDGKRTWEDITNNYPLFEQQETTK
ncbi:hypothetical protein SNE40_022433 [Patella caerulea]